MNKRIVASKNESKIYELAKAYVEDPSMLTYDPLKKEVFKLEGIKEKSKPVFLSKKVSASSEHEFEVTVNFGGYVGADNDYTVYADDEDSAIDQAVEDAKDDLEVVDVEDNGDGSWSIHIGFCGFVGVEETYEVDDADDEDAACEDALEQASWDLSGEVVSEYKDLSDFDEDEDEDEDEEDED